jgi:lipoprotein NlpD
VVMRTSSNTQVARVVCAFAAAALLVACSSSVVRENGKRGGGRVAAGQRVSAPKYGATAVVARGETLYRIATEHGISPLDLATWNAIAPPYTIYPGQRLRLYPSSGRRPVASAPVSGPRPSSSSAPPSGAPALPPPVSAPPRSAIAWRWPTDGQLVGGYVTGDPTRQGVDIAGNGGQPVRAAGDGVVVYSGSGLVGYGELIIIKHSEEWLSAYGHNRARLVNEGQVVKAGQQIAEMGRSGATRDLLHFEIRYNGKPVDPQQYLPRR